MFADLSQQVVGRHEKSAGKEIGRLLLVDAVTPEGIKKRKLILGKSLLLKLYWLTRDSFLKSALRPASERWPINTRGKIVAFVWTKGGETGND